MTEPQRKWSKLAVWSFILTIPGDSLIVLLQKNINPKFEIPLIFASILLCFPAFFIGNRAIRQIKLDKTLKGAILADIATWFSGWGIVFILISIYFILGGR
ncbi:MAG: hypothetical protein AAB038_02400 [Planctomycetota bacterium]